MNIENDKLIDRELSGSVIGAFYAVYNALGFGFLENVYASAMVLELGRRGLLVEREVPTQVHYLGQPIAMYRLDMRVERRLVVEIKASKALVEADRKQLFNYLRATNLQVGLLLHFGPEPKFHRLVSSKKSFQFVSLPLNLPDPR